jgi:hypothetical protein
MQLFFSFASLYGCTVCNLLPQLLRMPWRMNPLSVPADFPCVQVAFCHINLAHELGVSFITVLERHNSQA